MTSDDTPDTLPCHTCPTGEGRCYRERASTLANAYTLGCRAKDARAANAAKARERRARVRSGASNGPPTAWDDPENVPAREPTGETCECGSPYYWETGRGASVCGNGHWQHAPGTETRVIGESTSREIELADSGTPVSLMAERVNRAKLRALREQAEQWANKWIDALGNPENYDSDEWKREARQFAALLRGFIPEFRDADSERELSEIKQYVSSEVINSQAGQSLRTAFENARRRAEIARQREQDYDDDDEYDDDEYDDESDDESDDDAVTGEVVNVSNSIFPRATSRIVREGLATPASIAAQQHKAQVTPAVNVIGSALAMALIQQQKREREITEKGTCEFSHRFRSAVASRLYGVPQRAGFHNKMTGYAVPNTPAYRACSQHYDVAESRLNSEGYPDVCYWELPIVQTPSGNLDTWGSYGWT